MSSMAPLQRAAAEEFDSLQLRGQAPREGDPEWDGWSSLQAVQMDWYLMESTLTDALQSISESRTNLQRPMTGLRDELRSKGEGLVFATTSLPWADVYLFGDAARRIGKSLDDADFALRSARNQVALQQGFARTASSSWRSACAS